MRPGSRASLVRFALLALVFAWSAGAKAWPGRCEGPLRVFLPDDKAVPGWVRDGEPQEFEGEDLYTYIDGGAEIYEEYGFRRIVVQDYRGAAGQAISLEIFEMRTAAAAFGMYTFKRSGQGRDLALGGGGELEAYYLNFWKGRFVVTLTGFDETAETLAGLRVLAGAVAAKVTDAGEAPAIVVFLPKDGLWEASVKYLRGPLGLANVYDLHLARGLGFAEAAKGDYEDGSTLIVLSYGSPEAAAAGWAELRDHLARSGRFKRAAAEMVYRDGKGRFISIATRPAAVLIGIGADEAAARRRTDSAAAGRR